MPEIVTKDQLNNWIREEASRHEACGGCSFGGIHWHEPDETGCNWNVSIIRGPTARNCMEAMRAFGDRLRTRYNIHDPGEGFSYRDHQVAVEARPQRADSGFVYVAQVVIISGGQLRHFDTSVQEFATPGEAIAVGGEIGRRRVDEIVGP